MSDGQPLLVQPEEVKPPYEFHIIGGGEPADFPVGSAFESISFWRDVWTWTFWQVTISESVRDAAIRREKHLDEIVETRGYEVLQRKEISRQDAMELLDRA